jgi:L-threonylcarbamoyladenylate synthase
VRLNASEIRSGEAALLFGPEAPEGAARAVKSANLSQAGDLAEAASRLFSALRLLDASGAAAIAVAPIPETGLGEAINDRLRRAAAER